MAASNIKAWISAFRLRTLPLALSVIFMGSLLAASQSSFRWSVLILAVTTTLFLQILSNLANDYGDTQNGADSADRIGPARAVQSGAITAEAMKKAMVVFGILSLISGISLIVVSLTDLDWWYSVGFLVLGLASIAAAVKYTAGDNPYGYRGLGDIYVFLFFGLVGVLGSYYLHANRFDPTIILPAASMGLLSTGVLNLNNMRDRISDEKAGKITIPVRLGFASAKIYHFALVVSALVAAAVYVALNFNGYWNLLYLLSFPLFIRHLAFVAECNDPQALDPELKKLALSTLLFCILLGTGMLLA